VFLSYHPNHSLDNYNKSIKIPITENFRNVFILIIKQMNYTKNDLIDLCKDDKWINKLNNQIHT